MMRQHIACNGKKSQLNIGDIDFSFIYFIFHAMTHLGHQPFPNMRMAKRNETKQNINQIEWKWFQI